MKHAVLSVLLAASCIACASAGQQAGNSAAKEPTQEEGVLVGDVTREQIEEAVPDWAQGLITSRTDLQ
jgi:hypothetical protein